MSSTQPVFSADAWSRNLALYDATLALPFNAELTEGRLSLEAFRHYIVQDAKYLIAFGQALAVAAAKADRPDHIVQFAGAAREAVVVERALHEDYFGRFGLDAAAVARFALEEDVLLAPGDVFSASRSSTGFLRFNAAACAEPRIFEVLARSIDRAG